jgi:O-antigen/teichoic acid export membrane protein
MLVTKKNKDKELSILYCTVGNVQYIVLLLVLSGFIIFGKRFMILWAGEEYLESYYIAIILMVPNTINLIQNLGGEILRAKNLQKYKSIVAVWVAIANIISSIYLINYYGTIGAALGTCFAWIIFGGIFMNWFFAKYVKLDIKMFWLQIMRTTISIVPPIVVVKLLEYWFTTQSIGFYLIRILIYAIIYFLATYFFGLSKEQRNKLLVRIGKR